MELTDLQRSIEAILFASGDPVSIERIAIATESCRADVENAASSLMDDYAYSRRGIRIIRLDDSFQMCSSNEQAVVVTKALETRKPPKLSASLLEVLTIVAYYQPITKAYVEQLRGVDSSYSINALLNKKLISECGRLNVPGRPFLYRTTPDFLRTFGLQSLNELPTIDKVQLESTTDSMLLEQQEMKL